MTLIDSSTPGPTHIRSIQHPSAATLSEVQESRDMANKHTTGPLSPSGAIWIYLTLCAGTFAAWIPLLRHALPVADDFYYIALVKHGAYLQSLGYWRLLGQWIPLWLFLVNPIYPTIAALLTQLLNAILLFHLCRSLFGGIRLPLAASLAFSMTPVGYQAMTWMIDYAYVIAVTFFLANILLLVSVHSESHRPASLVVALSALLALLTCLGNECLFFAVACSGLFALLEVSPDTVPGKSIAAMGRRWLLALAPAAGCLLWVVLYYTFKGQDRAAMERVTHIHPMAILSVYLRQYSALDVLTPWFNPVARSFLFFHWTALTAGATALAILGLIFGLIRCSRMTAHDYGKPGLRSLIAIAALLFGAALIYAVAGGYSWDSRKKYPLLLLALAVDSDITMAGTRRLVHHASVSMEPGSDHPLTQTAVGLTSSSMGKSRERRREGVMPRR